MNPLTAGKVTEQLLSDALWCRVVQEDECPTGAVHSRRPQHLAADAAVAQHEPVTFSGRDVNDAPVLVHERESAQLAEDASESRRPAYRRVTRPLVLLWLLRPWLRGRRRFTTAAAKHLLRRRSAKRLCLHRAGWRRGTLRRCRLSHRSWLVQERPVRKEEPKREALRRAAADEDPFSLDTELERIQRSGWQIGSR
jgi:hypothetical protein